MHVAWDLRPLRTNPATSPPINEQEQVEDVARTFTKTLRNDPALGTTAPAGFFVTYMAERAGTQVPT
jgi:hypothetical protein